MLLLKKIQPPKAKKNKGKKGDQGASDPDLSAAAEMAAAV
jgi:hypothetical protein